MTKSPQREYSYITLHNFCCIGSGTESTMNTRNTKDNFYPQILTLVIPIIIQNLLSAAVSSADVVMLNYVGQSSISAVSLASNYANVLHMVFYGLGTGATILSAQYWGKKDMRAIQVIEGIALRFSLLISMIFSAFALFAPDLMMRLFTTDAELIRIGAGYLRIMSITYLCWAVRIIRYAASWSNRRRNRYRRFQNDRAAWMFSGIYAQQGSQTKSGIHIYPS